MKIQENCVIIGAVGGFFMKIFGGFDYSLKAMLLLMVIDIFSGFISAWMFNTSKYSKNGVTSDALLKGAVRKISMLSIVSIGVVIDGVMGFNYVRNGVVMYFIATEGISILEHMIHIGIPVPKFVGQMLENMREDTIDEIDTKNSNK